MRGNEASQRFRVKRRHQRMLTWGRSTLGTSKKTSALPMFATTTTPRTSDRNTNMVDRKNCRGLMTKMYRGNHV